MSEPITRAGEMQYAALPAGPITGLWGQVYNSRDGSAAYQHRGLDIGNFGNQYSAGTWGRVLADSEWTNNGNFNGYGAFGLGVVIDHGGGEFRYTLFAHNSRVLVSPGQLVDPDTPIAVSGATGDVVGGHIHIQRQRDTRFSVEIADSADPLRYLLTEADMDLVKDLERLNAIVAGNGMMCVPWADVPGEESVLGLFPGGTKATPRDHPDPNSTAVLLTQGAALEYSRIRGFSLGYGVFLARNDIANHMKGHA